MKYEEWGVTQQCVTPKLAYEAGYTAACEEFRQQLHDAKNAHYLSQAHELCTRMGVPPGHIEDRLFEALGKLRITSGIMPPGVGDVRDAIAVSFAKKIKG